MIGGMRTTESRPQRTGEWLDEERTVAESPGSSEDEAGVSSEDVAVPHSVKRAKRWTRLAPRGRPKLSRVFKNAGDARARLSVRALLVATALFCGAGLGLATTFEPDAISNLESALATGSAFDVREAADAVHAWEKPFDRRGALALAEAIAYRFVDLDPTRATRVMALTADRGDDRAILARALVGTVADRVSALASLASMAQTSWTGWAVVSALESLGESRAAQRVMGTLVRDEETPGATVLGTAQLIDPAHAGKRFWGQLGERAAGRQGWWRLAKTRLAADDGADMPPSVAVEGHLTRVFQLAGRNGKTGLVTEHLRRAAQYSAHQPSVLFDAAERFLRASRPGLARRALELAEDGDSLERRSIEGRILMAEGKASEARESLEGVWQAGFRSPVVLIALLDLGWDGDAEQIGESHRRLVSYVIARGRMLVASKKFSEASTWLQGELLSLVGVASDSQLSRVYELLAAAERALGNRAGADNYAARAAELGTGRSDLALERTRQ